MSKYCNKIFLLTKTVSMVNIMLQRVTKSDITIRLLHRVECEYVQLNIKPIIQAN